jgi:hypothetical protein
LSQQQAVHLQGSRPWETLWNSLMEFTDEFNLTRVRLDVNIPAVNEDYHATWVRESYDDRWPQWQTEIPLRSGERPLGSLVMAGLHDGFSACGQIAKVMEALCEFEARFEETIAGGGVAAVAEPAAAVGVPASVEAEVSQVAALSGPQ